MKRFVNGDEVELSETKFLVTRLHDRILVHTDEGTFSAVAVRIGDSVFVSYKGRQYRVDDRAPRAQSGSHGGSGELRAPMPGAIVEIRKEAGDPVAKGEAVLVLEAMKTQQPLAAPFAGKLLDLRVRVGDQVNDGDLLAVVEQDEPVDE
ncbi:MAG: biotin/lipoyl-binding protein [Fimbriimonas sp.]|nr:biotin/lipoyl-binding protein [Fimbriimonas sp.]